MRDLLIDAFNLWFKISEVELTKIKYIVRMLHNASLLYVPKRGQKEVSDVLMSGFSRSSFHPWFIFRENWSRP